MAICIQTNLPVSAALPVDLPVFFNVGIPPANIPPSDAPPDGRAGGGAPPPGPPPPPTRPNDWLPDWIPPPPKK